MCVCCVCVRARASPSLPVCVCVCVSVRLTNVFCWSIYARVYPTHVPHITATTFHYRSPCHHLQLRQFLQRSDRGWDRAAQSALPEPAARHQNGKSVISMTYRAEGTAFVYTRTVCRCNCSGRTDITACWSTIQRSSPAHVHTLSRPAKSKIPPAVTDTSHNARPTRTVVVRHVIKKTRAIRMIGVVLLAYINIHIHTHTYIHT